MSNVIKITWTEEEKEIVQIKWDNKDYNTVCYLIIEKIKPYINIQEETYISLIALFADEIRKVTKDAVEKTVFDIEPFTIKFNIILKTFVELNGGYFPNFHYDF